LQNTPSLSLPLNHHKNGKNVSSLNRSCSEAGRALNINFLDILAQRVNIATPRPAQPKDQVCENIS